MPAFSIAGFRPGNLAERLGYPTGARLLIVHADDLGTFRAVNGAYIGMLKAGMVTSAAVNAPGKDFDEIAAYFNARPDLDFGVHITLSSEFRNTPMAPVLPAEKVRSLVNEEGFFPPWIPKTAKPEEVAAEIRAQIGKVLAAGITPTHIDTHMGTVYSSYATVRAYIDVAREFRLPAMALSPRSDRVRGRIGGFPLFRGIAGTVYRWRVRGTPLLDELIADVAWDQEMRLSFRRERLLEAIRGLKPGVSQILIHPALDDPEMPRYDDWRFFTANRIQDAAVFSDPETKKVIEAEGIRLIGWRPIKALV